MTSALAVTFVETKDRSNILWLKVKLKNWTQFLKQPVHAVSIKGLALLQADRSSILSGKSWGSGLCIYMNSNWCNNARVVSSSVLSSAQVELLTVNCRHFYQPLEFNVVSITAVYVPPSATTKEARSVLYRTFSELQTAHTKVVFIVSMSMPMSMSTCRKFDTGR